MYSHLTILNTRPLPFPPILCERGRLSTPPRAFSTEATSVNSEGRYFSAAAIDLRAHCCRLSRGTRSGGRVARSQAAGRGVCELSDARRHGAQSFARHGGLAVDGRCNEGLLEVGELHQRRALAEESHLDGLHLQL